VRREPADSQIKNEFGRLNGMGGLAPRGRNAIHSCFRRAPVAIMHRLAVSVQNFKLFFEKRPISPGAKTHRARIRLSQPAIKIKLNVRKNDKKN
jgi:hypothetical protein